jgi:hypothetical protein
LWGHTETDPDFFQEIARHWVVGTLYLDAYFQPAGVEAAHLGGRVAASFVNELWGLQGDLPDEVGCLSRRHLEVEIVRLVRHQQAGTVTLLQDGVRVASAATFV